MDGLYHPKVRHRVPTHLVDHSGPSERRSHLPFARYPPWDSANRMCLLRSICFGILASKREKNPNLGKIFNRCRVCRAHAHPLDKLPVRIAVLHSVFPPYHQYEILSLLDEVPIQFEDFTVAAPVDNLHIIYSERLPRAPDPHPAEHHVALQPRPAAVDG